MINEVFRSINEEIRKDISIDERWDREDKGLISCWEVGREKGISNPELAARAEVGELPILGW